MTCCCQREEGIVEVMLGVLIIFFCLVFIARVIPYIVLGIAIMITGGLYSWKTLFLIAPLWWIGALLMVLVDEACLIIYAIDLSLSLGGLFFELEAHSYSFFPKSSKDMGLCIVPNAYPVII